MANILMIGIDPEEVDFTDPALPPGLNADKIRAGIAVGLERLTAGGHTAVQMYVSADPARLDEFAARLSAEAIDCVTVGGGITRPPQNTELLEALLNIIVRADRPPHIALVLGPENALAAVERVMGQPAERRKQAVPLQ